MKMLIKELEELGWVFDYFYAPGQENMYSKNGKSIRVGNYKPPAFDKDYTPSENLPEAKYLLTYSGYQTRDIESIEDLKNYELTGR